MKKSLLKICLALLVPVYAPWAQAQLIDDVSIRGEAGETVVQVRFVTPVQYQRVVTMPSGDFVQAFYEVLPPREGLNLADSGQRRVIGGDRLPRVTITDESVGDRGASRKLVVRFAEPQRARVRAGRGNRSIEFVLAAMSAPRPASPPASAPPRRVAPPASAPPLAPLPTPVPAVAPEPAAVVPPAPVPVAPAAASAPEPAPAPAVPASAPAVPAPPPERYLIVIKAVRTEGQPPEIPVPQSLQGYTVFTEKRVLGDRTVYELNLGYFNTRAEAERARSMLVDRFPRALIVDMNKPRVTEFEAEPDAPAVAVTPSSPQAELDSRAAQLLATARDAQARRDLSAALDAVGRVLDMPLNASTRDAQALVGLLRAQSGDVARARAEMELFLATHPNSPDAERVRAELARLPAPPPRPRAKPLVAPMTTLAGSFSLFYYGGQSKVRTQEFQDSPISGLPELTSDNTYAAADQKQAVSSVDVNWRHRDADRDMRFVFRDSYTADMLNSDRSRNRLSALYFDHRSTPLGTNIRVGRQSGTGGGVLGRFDGVNGGYLVAPRWRVNAVAGMPADKLLDSKRRFYGSSIDAEALTPELSGSLYVIQQTIDGEVDRRALGSELRYFSGGVSAFGTLDYDQVLKDINIAMVQGTWQTADNTVVNLLIDRRATPMLSLGNVLFFQTTSPPAQSVRELLANGATVGDLRQQVKGLNSYTTQGVFGVTTPLSKQWQIGGDIRSTQIGEIAPVPTLLPYGQKPTRVLSLGGQLIGTNLYSARDTHVVGLSWLRGSTQVVAVADPIPENSTFRDSTYTAVLLNYNNSSLVQEALTLEPSIKFYRQTDNAGLKTTRWTPGLRLTYRLARQLTAESELTAESSKTRSPARNESSTRVYYYLGARYDF